MFSQGQLTFAVFFVIAFIIAAVFVYRRDAKLHKVFYKGSYRILIGFLMFIGLLFVIKIFLKR
ncbi:MAG TPA: hypothetical protein VF676_00760 [Flavobacterium sp.]|jgi:uncharacterized membrane protein YccC